MRVFAGTKPFGQQIAVKRLIATRIPCGEAQLPFPNRHRVTVRRGIKLQAVGRAHQNLPRHRACVIGQHRQPVAILPEQIVGQPVGKIALRVGSIPGEDNRHTSKLLPVHDNRPDRIGIRGSIRHAVPPDERTSLLRNQHLVVKIADCRNTAVCRGCFQKEMRSAPPHRKVPIAQRVHNLGKPGEADQDRRLFRICLRHAPIACRRKFHPRALADGCGQCLQFLTDFRILPERLCHPNRERSGIGGKQNHFSIRFRIGFRFGFMRGMGFFGGTLAAAGAEKQADANCQEKKENSQFIHEKDHSDFRCHHKRQGCFLLSARKSG